MLRSGILHPQLLHLLARIRHTNTLVLADRGFPFWPQVETIDLAVVDGLPTVNQLLDALLPNFVLGRVFAAEEFKLVNTPAAVAALTSRFPATPLHFEPHTAFKQRVPAAIGLIRTADTLHYSNLILESA